MYDKVDRLIKKAATLKNLNISFSDTVHDNPYIIKAVQQSAKLKRQLDEKVGEVSMKLSDLIESQDYNISERKGPGE